VSWYAYDVNGYVADVASIGGWQAFRAWARAQGGALAAFIDKGSTRNLPELRAELKAYRAPDADVDSVRRSLLAATDKASQVLILSDGETTADDEEPADA
jgi:hypothetical protein